MPDNQFHRDFSGRLAFEMFNVPADSYSAITAEVAAAFGLVPAGLGINLWDIVFRDYQCGEAVVGLEWDNWSGFIVVAKNPVAEPLVTDIVAYLLASAWATATAPS